MRTVEFYSSGICDNCKKWKPTITFHIWESGYEGYDVEIEYCQDCLNNIFEKGDEQTNGL